MILGSTRLNKLPIGMKIKQSHFTSIELNNLALIGKNTSKLHLIVDSQRIGGELFNVTMEYTLFPPNTEKNKLFDMDIVKWPTDNMIWAISSFPIEYKKQAEQYAQEIGLRLADGIPILMNPFTNEAEIFPINGETVFTLENVKGHKSYSNDPVQIERLRNQERAACQKIFDEHLAVLRVEMKTEGYTDVQIERIMSVWENGNPAYDEKPENYIKDGVHQHRNKL